MDTSFNKENLNLFKSANNDQFITSYPTIKDPPKQRQSKRGKSQQNPSINNPRKHVKSRSLSNITNLQSTIPRTSAQITKRAPKSLSAKCQSYTSVLSCNLELLLFLIHVSKALALNSDSLSYQKTILSARKHSSSAEKDTEQNQAYWDSLEKSVLLTVNK